MKKQIDRWRGVVLNHFAHVNSQQLVPSKNELGHIGVCSSLIFGTAMAFTYWTRTTQQDVTYFNNIVDQAVSFQLNDGIGILGLLVAAVAWMFLSDRFARVANALLVSTAVGLVLTLGVISAELVVSFPENVTIFEASVLVVVTGLLLAMALVHTAIVWYASWFVIGSKGKESPLHHAFNPAHWSWRVGFGALLGLITVTAFSTVS